MSSRELPAASAGPVSADPAPLAPPSETRRPAFGVGMVLGAAALWGTLGTVYTLTIGAYGLTPLAVVFYRALFSTVAIGAWMLGWRRDLLRVRRADWPLLAAYGLLGVTIFYVAYIYAIVLVGVTTAVVLLYTAPAFVAVLAWRFLGESFSGRKLGALLLTFAGVVLISGAYDPGQLRGNAPGLACGILAASTYALYSIFGKLANARRIPLPTLLFYTLGLGCLGLLALILVQAPGDLAAPGARPGVWAVLVMLGTVQTLAPVAAYTISLRHLDAGVASICATFEPVVAAVLAFVVLHEPLGGPEVVGGALILLAVGLLQGGTRRRARRPGQGGTTAM